MSRAISKIAVLIPTERESAFVDASAVPFRVCGAGMAECAAATAKIIVGEKPGLMILAGIAGAYADGPAIGETVVVGSETVADMGRLSEGSFAPLFPKTYPAVATVAGYRVVDSNTVNCAGTLIGRPVKAAIENMEGAAFFAVCERFGVPAVEVRTVSNRVGEPVSPENMAAAARNLAAELESIIKSLETV